MCSKRRLVLWLVSLAALAGVGALPAPAGANHSALGEWMSRGSIGGNAELPATFRKVSTDGTRVFFDTREALVAGDTDTQADIYQRFNGTTTLMSTGTTGGNGAFASTFAAISQDGLRVFFTTRESLVSGDTDAQIDIYERNGATTTLLSTGPAGGNDIENAIFDGITPTGSHVFFHTFEPLVSGDTDDQIDVYDRSGGTTTLVSTGPAGGNGDFISTYAGSSSDGTKVFLETDEALTSDDDDTEVDVYQRSGGTTSRLSFGPAGGNGNPSENELFDAFFAGASDDGTKVFLETDEALTSDDLDVTGDVYQRSGGVTTRLTTSPTAGDDEIDATFAGATSDGSRVWFLTAEPMTASDTDLTAVDVYERSSGTTTLISTSASDPGSALPAAFAGANQTGTIVFFTTASPLVAADTDTGWRDVYQRSAGTTTLLSTGPSDPSGSLNATFSGASQDGSRVFFQHGDGLVAGDTDGGMTDVYERSGGATTLLSVGPNGGNGPNTAAYGGSSQDGTTVLIHSGEKLAIADTDASQDVYAATVAPLYPRPGSGTPLRIPLVNAYQACTSPNSTHVMPLNYPGCSPPVRASTLLTTGTVGLASGFVRMKAVNGNPATPADEADVTLAAAVNDVRNSPAGTDYVGQVMLSAALRLTDTAHGPSATLPGTVQNAELSIPISCTGTPANPNKGSTCSISTTLDAQVPGLMVEERRSILSMLSIKVLDAGADGNLTPAPGPIPCPPDCGTGDEKEFFTEGVFTP